MVFLNAMLAILQESHLFEDGNILLKVADLVHGALEVALRDASAHLGAEASPKRKKTVWDS
jgi:hypothetical protein